MAGHDRADDDAAAALGRLGKPKLFKGQHFTSSEMPSHDSLPRRTGRVMMEQTFNLKSAAVGLVLTVMVVGVGLAVALL